LSLYHAAFPFLQTEGASNQMSLYKDKIMFFPASEIIEASLSLLVSLGFVPSKVDFLREQFSSLTSRILPLLAPPLFISLEPI